MEEGREGGTDRGREEGGRERGREGGREVPTGVQVPIVEVGSLGVSQYICLHPPLGWFFGHILNEAEPPLECNHAFINADLIRQCIVLLEIVEERVNEGS